MRSQCCNAPMKVQGDTTMWYKCLRCRKPCDPMTHPVKEEQNTMSNLQEKSQDAGATEERELPKSWRYSVSQLRLERSVPVYGEDEEYVGHHWCAVVPDDVKDLLQAAERRGAEKALDILFKEGEMYRFIDYQGEQWVHNSFYNDMIRGRGEVLETLVRLTESDKRIMEG